MLLERCLSVCPVCDVGVLWPNGSMDQDETWHRGPGLIVPHSGPPGARGPRFIEPPEPPVSTPLCRNVAENFDRLRMVHERYRRQTDGRQRII